MDGPAAPEPSAVAHTGDDRIVFFALEPFNFAIPFLGIVDDVFVLPLLLRLLAKLAARATQVHIEPRPRDERVVSVQ
jgi:hypothetical protein